MASDAYEIRKFDRIRLHMLDGLIDGDASRLSCHSDGEAELKYAELRKKFLEGQKFVARPFKCDDFMVSEVLVIGNSGYVEFEPVEIRRSANFGISSKKEVRVDIFSSGSLSAPKYSFELSGGKSVLRFMLKGSDPSRMRYELIVESGISAPFVHLEEKEIAAIAHERHGERGKEFGLEFGVHARAHVDAQSAGAGGNPLFRAECERCMALQDRVSEYEAKSHLVKTKIGQWTEKRDEARKWCEAYERELQEIQDSHEKECEELRARCEMDEEVLGLYEDSMIPEVGDLLNAVKTDLAKLEEHIRCFVNAREKARIDKKVLANQSVGVSRRFAAREGEA